MAQDTDNRREDQIYDINSTFVTGGLQTDVSEVNQPQGTQRYVLNGIRETVNKDINTLSNDYSNEQLNTDDVPLNSTTLEKDYLLGSIYLNDDEFVLFILTYKQLVPSGLKQISKLYLFNSVTKTMQLLISDENSEEEDKLHFNEHHQIQGIYRLRRGCDRTIYFTDNFNAPRTINIDKLYNYHSTNETYAISSKFNLIRSYSKIPEFKKYIGKDQDDEPIYEIGVKVKEGGKLLPGGYNLTIRLLDDDLNTTDWITTTDVVVISNFSDNEYTEMKGSTAKVTDWQNFGNTDKLIEVSVLSNSIDTNFKFLQFGLIYANSGDGTVGGVYVSPMIGIEEEGNAPDNYTYQFTGAVEYDKDTAESVSFGPINVGKAKTITSSQNRLLLGNIESKQVDWCKLQKYASKIAACCEVKKIQLKETENNIANAIHNLEDNGYMPGEIYSFGIVYVFDDGTTSPAYHIPGSTAPIVSVGGEPTQTNLVDGLGDNTENYYSMDVVNNKCENINYIKRGNCNDNDFWGKDYFGNNLEGTPVRHHRFPTREKLGIQPIISLGTYDCKAVSCDADKKGEKCNSDYYLELPYNKVTNHYKKNHSSFDLDIYLAIYDTSGPYQTTKNTDGSNGDPSKYQYMPTLYDDNHNVICSNYRVECLEITINIDDWDSSRTGSNNKTKYYRLKLGNYDYPPKLVGISEIPVKYVRTDGEGGIRYGWETTAGWQKIKYKRVDVTTDNSWEEDPNGNYPLTEDGLGLEKVFYGSFSVEIKGKYKTTTAPVENNIKFTFSTGATQFLKGYLENNSEKDYCNISVANIESIEKYFYFASFGFNTTKKSFVRNIRSNKDLNFSKCTKQYRTYQVPIFGIHFWNIEIPLLKDTNGNKIIGYYIVRNKRDEDNKTILDSAVTFPLSQDVSMDSGTLKYNNDYISYGFSISEDKNNAYTDKAIAFISPEFKYLNKKYKNFTFVRQGEFYPLSWQMMLAPDPNEAYNCPCGDQYYNAIVSTCLYDKTKDSLNKFKTSMIMGDVQPGTSYNKKENKKTEYDNDGFELYSMVRERGLSFDFLSSLEIKPSKIKYLDALDDTVMDDGDISFIHNLSSDNAIGIMELGADSTITGIEDDPNFYKKVNYGYLKVDVPNPYGNFRQLPYYKESKYLEPLSYNDTQTRTTIFSGDVYTTPMKYWNSVYYNTRIRYRRRKSGLAQIIIGAVSTAASIVGGAFATIYSGGAALQVSVAAVKASFSLMMSGIKMEKVNVLYRILYFKGLKQTLEDKWVNRWAKNINPEDDQVQWVFEVLNSLWFESTVNQFWRVGTSGDLPDFLEPLKIYNTQDYVTYITNKMTVADDNQNNGRLYQGFATAEYYEVNPDYMRGNIQKAFYHLPIQYDCCSKCLERYPHRVMYSEVSFQEELTDNYTTFLANNYRDIPGETGEITNLFQQDTFLYIQTEEGLWNMPVGTQEIKTQGLTTYLGNGSFFSNEPQRISDAGLGSKYQHGTLITKDGIFFIDEQYGKVYLLQKGKTAYGKSTLGTPIPIIDLGMSYWGKDNVKSFTDEEYRKEHGGLHYPHLDNPASEGGMGYLSVYDEKNERFILTKKDIVKKKFYKMINGEKVYIDDTYIVFNGKYYSTNVPSSFRPSGELIDYEFIEFKDNKAIYGGYGDCELVDFGGNNDIIGTQDFVPGYYTVTSKSILFKYVDENGVELTAGQISDYNLTFANDVELDFSINGVPGTCNINTAPNQSVQFDNHHEDVNSTITLDNLQTIIDGVFVDANQQVIEYTTSNITTEESCDTTLVINVIVTTTTNDECTLTVKKKFRNVPEGTTPEDIMSLLVDDPHILVNGIQFNLVGGVIDQVDTTMTIEFDVLPVDCNETNWEDGQALTIDETGLFVDNQMPVGWVLSGSSFTGRNTKILTIINDYEDGGDDNSDDNLEEPINDGEAKSVRGLRDGEGTPCSEGSDYDDFVITFDKIVCKYKTIEVYLTEIFPEETIDNSWTISFNMKTMSWQSFHSYLPNFYIGAKDIFYSFKLDEEGLWKHNVEGNFGTYYDKHYDFIVDFVSVSENGIATKVWNDIYVIADVERYDDILKDYYDINDVFFNKAIVWNHRQCSKELELLLKENQQDENYLYNQIINEDGKITVDRNERNWAFNGFRDNVNHNQKQPMWIKKYDGDVKKLNMDIFDFGNNVLQNWYETEIFRGKFLEVMLKFTNFAVVNGNDVDDTNVKIIMYFTIEGRNKTVR